MAGTDHDTMDFCTLGMFIIDEIHFKPPTPSQYDILGGAGSYAAVGARIMRPPPASQKIGWIVDCGSDFPPAVRKTIEAWNTGCLFRETPERLTTRGWNGYGENEHRAFKYTTPKLRLDHHSLDERLLSARSFHLISSPTRCEDLVNGILEQRRSIELQDQPPLFIWEPVPDLCVVSEQDNLLSALKHVDIISPNHGELCGFFGVAAAQDDSVMHKNIEECCAKLVNSGIGSTGKGAVVVRAGKDGCFIANKKGSFWLPAFFANDQARVVDPTGGGNAFLGGFSTSLAAVQSAPLELLSLFAAAVDGSVAASFAIEQVGMPTVANPGPGELWNGDRVEDRRQRLVTNSAATLDALSRLYSENSQAEGNE